MTIDEAPVSTKHKILLLFISTSTSKCPLSVDDIMMSPSFEVIGLEGMSLLINLLFKISFL